MIFPFAVYTAEQGLSWKYSGKDVSIAELDVCRTLLGPLPDFSIGESGYEGVASVGDRVFVMRCFCAQKWDFRGRDAVYLAVTWFSREDAEVVDVEKILISPVMCEPSHSSTCSFSSDAEGCGAVIKEGERWRRPIGRDKWERWFAPRSLEIFEEEKLTEIKDVSCNCRLEEPQMRHSATRWLIWLAVAAVLIVFLMDLWNKREQGEVKGDDDDRSGEMSFAPTGVETGAINQDHRGGGSPGKTFTRIGTAECRIDEPSENRIRPQRLRE